MATGRIDPYAQYNFLVEIDGVTRAGFTEIGGLTTEQDAIDYREGNETATVRKLPGLRKYSNITLKRGFTQDKELWQWRKTTIDGVTERRSGSIVLLDEARNEVLRWNFREGWIIKWEGPALKATANETAIEALEIVHEGLELV
ncbi:MAG: phage tail protein [Anaerolineales bacterium]|nr:phage tail protein [Anaerolineales bacterium]MCB8952942.1 phage tail protein [Ardenticatenales bacterium]